MATFFALWTSCSLPSRFQRRMKCMTFSIRNSPFSYHRIWQLSWPIMLSNISLPLVGTVDVAMMGHLSDPSYVGGVGLGMLIFNLLYFDFSFLRMSTTGFTARARRRRQRGRDHVSACARADSGWIIRNSSSACLPHADLVCQHDL